MEVTKVAEAFGMRVTNWYGASVQAATRGVRFPVHAAATTPARRLGVLLRSLHPAVSAFPRKGRRVGLALWQNARRTRSGSAFAAVFGCDERGHLQKVRLSATPLVAQDAARARSSVIPTRPHFLHFCRKSLALGRVIEFCHGPAIESVADCIPSEAGKFTRIAAPYRRFDTAPER